MPDLEHRDADRCAVPVPPSRPRATATTRPRPPQSPKVDTVDLNPAFCPGAPVCQAVVDGRWCGATTTTTPRGYAVARRDQAWNILKDALPGTTGR